MLGEISIIGGSIFLFWLNWGGEGSRHIDFGRNLGWKGSRLFDCRFPNERALSDECYIGLAVRYLRLARGEQTAARQLRQRLGTAVRSRCMNSSNLNACWSMFSKA